MKNILLIFTLIFPIISFSQSQNEWLFEVKTENLKMMSNNKLSHPSEYVKNHNVKNMVNLSPTWKNSFLPPYADGTHVEFSDPMRGKKKYTYISIHPPIESFSHFMSITSPKTKKSFGVGWNFIKDKSHQVSVGYPSLIHNGNLLKIKKNSRSPRVTIGVYWTWNSKESKTVQTTYIYVTTNSTLKQVQQKMKSLNCHDAVVLDSKPFLYIDGKHVYSSDSNAVYPNVLTW